MKNTLLIFMSLFLFGCPPKDEVNPCSDHVVVNDFQGFYKFSKDEKELLLPPTTKCKTYLIKDITFYGEKLSTDTHPDLQMAIKQCSSDTLPENIHNFVVFDYDNHPPKGCGDIIVRLYSGIRKPSNIQIHRYEVVEYIGFSE